MSDETQEPTLRNGDQSVDGWVEYAKGLLLETALIHDVEFDWESGTFDDTTEWLVRQFQSDHHLQVDGVIGNQTWAALRGEEPQAVGTDGGEPGTHVEAGLEARWNREDAATFDPRDDRLILIAFNTGSDPLRRDNFDIDIALETRGRRIDVADYRFTRAADGGSVADPGDLIWILVDDMLSLTGSTSADELDDLHVTARMSSELGGDVMETSVTPITY
jgi:hypothetical protein